MGSATWAEFAAAAPELAAHGDRLLHARGHGEALLATVRGDAPPRIHPVSVEIVDGRLYVFVIVGSAKVRDLEEDARFALHTHVDAASPSEFAIRGRAREVEDASLRAAVAAVWSFEADDGYRLFELGVGSALAGSRETADDWPPRYASWTAPAGTGR
jgi:hypothetical protein